MDMSFEDWYAILQDLAEQHDESVADADAWREAYEDGQSAEEAFYDEYPEHAPEDDDEDEDEDEDDDDDDED